MDIVGLQSFHGQKLRTIVKLVLGKFLLDLRMLAIHGDKTTKTQTPLVCFT